MTHQPPTGAQDLARAGSGAVIEAEILTAPIADPRRLLPTLDALAARCNVVTPPALVFLEGWSLVPVPVRINPTVNADGVGPEVYYSKQFMGERERGLGKVALMKIAAAAGVKWTQNTGRRDDMRTPNFWAYYAEGLVDLPDGSYTIISGEKEVDLRDGSSQIGGWTPEAWAKSAAIKDWKERVRSVGGFSDRQVAMARQMGLAMCETKAKLRAIRSLGLQPKYSLEELAKPFVVFKAVFQPDMSDPAIKRMVTERALHGRQLLYPSSVGVPAAHALLAPRPPAGTIDVPAEPPPPASQTPVGLTIVDVQQVSHNGKAIDLWDVSLSDGRVARTNSAEIVQGAATAREQAWLVEVSLEPSPARPGAFRLVELSRAQPATPSLPADLY